MPETSFPNANEGQKQTNWPEIPGYRIESVLHQGLTATVYRAIQIALNRPVAIKVIHAAAQDATLNTAPWYQEAVLRAKLSHPHIAAVYDSGRVGNDIYFVMEYVAGQSLREQMSRGQPWRVRRALEVLQAVAEALDYIHARGLLHLDLKPENVLVTETGHAKVTDFGLSQWMYGEHANGRFWGTCDYCAPEQRFGLGVDRGADVFSLAVLAYELLTGYVPGRVYVSARRYNRLLPAGVDKVLAKGLARDREERYNSALAFYQDLADALLDYRQHPVWGSLAALGIAAVVIIPLLLQRGGWTWQPPQPSAQRLASEGSAASNSAVTEIPGPSTSTSQRRDSAQSQRCPSDQENQP